MYDRIDVYQRYCLGNFDYHNHFEFDFISKKAKFVNEELIQNFSKSKTVLYDNFENKEIANSLINSHVSDDFLLSDDDIISIKWDFKECIENIDDYNLNYYKGIGIISHFTIITTKGSESNEYNIINKYPYSLDRLAGSIIYILGFDLLNSNLKKLITPYKYNIYHDGVFCRKTGERLNLNKINFNISSNNEKDALNISLKSSDEYFSDILSLLTKYRVYRWYDKDYLENIKMSKYEFLENNGNTWILELIFENGEVLNLRGKNAYPDTYFGFGQEILNLTGKDYLKINNILDKDNLIEYNNNKLSIDDGRLDKISIMQNYNLEPSFIEEFIIDFKNKRAYWDLNPDFFTNILEYKELYESPYNLSFNLFEKLYSKVSFETYELSEEKINEFIKKFDFIESFPIYTEEKMYDNYVSLREFFNIYVTSYHPYGKKREYLIEENFPEQWSYFGELIEDLIGFDVLNIKDLKYLTSNINHDFKDNRFYKNDVELGIAKIKFKHYYSHIINDND